MVCANSGATSVGFSTCRYSKIGIINNDFPLPTNQKLTLLKHISRTPFYFLKPSQRILGNIQFKQRMRLVELYVQQFL
jgi:hypothetical protein